MSNILIINGAKKFAHSNGQLNDTLTEVAEGYPARRRARC